MKEGKLENDELDSLLPEVRNNSFHQVANMSNSYDTALLDHVKEELLKHEPFIKDETSNDSHNVPEYVKTTSIRQKINENSKILSRQDFSETRNNAIPEDIKFDNSDGYYNTSVDLVKQESDEIVVKHEPFIQEEMSTEVEENGKIWCRDGFAETWSLNFVKIEMSENFDVENYSQLKKHKCHHCPYSSSFKGHLRRHINSVHLKLKNHECHLCDYRSSRKGDLKRHISSIHWKLKNQKCHLCDYTASQKEYLQYHINSVHLKLKNHKCHLCDFSSSLKGHLKSHFNSVHLKLKNHKCHLCDHTASRKEHLQSHINSVHLKLKNHKCHLCEFICSRKSRLQKHIRTQH